MQTQIDNINGLIAQGDGTLSGDAYQALTRSKAPLDLAEGSTNPQCRRITQALIRDQLDDALANVQRTPMSQDALSQARYQYRVMRTIDPLVGGSRDRRTSRLTPSCKRCLPASRRFERRLGGMAYTGGGNIGELARIGKLMRAPPQTGTADRMLINAAAVGWHRRRCPRWPLTSVDGADGTAGRSRRTDCLGLYLRSGSTAGRLINAVAPDPDAS